MEKPQGPMTIGVTVILSRKLKDAMRVAPTVVRSALHTAMQASVLETETSIKKFITEIGLVDVGRLRSSIHGRVLAVNIHQTTGEVATTNVKYARIHEYGGTISAKPGKALAIPFNKQSALIQMQSGGLRNVKGLYVIRRAGGNAFLFRSGDSSVGWTLVKSVKISEKRYMRTGLERAMPRVKQFFHTVTNRALKQVFGGDDG